MVSAIAVMSAEQYELATKHAQDFSDMTKRHNRLMADLLAKTREFHRRCLRPDQQAALAVGTEAVATRAARNAIMKETGCDRHRAAASLDAQFKIHVDIDDIG